MRMVIVDVRQALLATWASPEVALIPGEAMRALRISLALAQRAGAFVPLSHFELYPCSFEE
jgi:hypothetical protein